MESKQLFFFIIWCFIIFNDCGVLQMTTAHYVQVTTAQGILQGIKLILQKNPILFYWFLGKPYYSFVGIPYAQPPVGHLRFKSPQPPIPWTGVRNAFVPGSECVQSLVAEIISGSEDCLYLNVYTPELPTNGIPLKPVMVWIHGGAFKIGNGYSLYGPDFLVEQDVLLVTLNYRLGPLGFLSLEDDILSGNYGLKDQVQALRWVQQNIASFGGDPNQVTIFGHSAGGASVHYHMLSPLSKGLFKNAIVQSGSAVSSWAFNPRPKESAYLLAQKLGYNTTEKITLYNIFLSKSSSELIKASNAVFNDQTNNVNILNMGLSFVPCIEIEGNGEKFITQSPREILQAGNFTKVPLIMGTLNGDGIYFLYAKMLTYNFFKTANEKTEWAVPHNWNFEPGKEKYDIGQKIKEYYFQYNVISWNNIQAMTEFVTDKLFVMDTQYALSEHLNNSNTPVFNYEFTLETFISTKLLIPLVQFRFVNVQGAAHGDECQMFFVPPGIYIPLSNQEKVVSDKLLKMWTSFAKTGNPNYVGSEVTWQPLRRSNYSYLEIGSTFKIREGKVRAENTEFWKALCKQASTNYKNPNYVGSEVTWQPLRRSNYNYLEIGSTFKIREGKVRAENTEFWKALCKQASTNYKCSAL